MSKSDEEAELDILIEAGTKLNERNFSDVKVGDLDEELNKFLKEVERIESNINRIVESDNYRVYRILEINPIRNNFKYKPDEILRNQKLLESYEKFVNPTATLKDLQYLENNLENVFQNAIQSLSNLDDVSDRELIHIKDDLLALKKAYLNDSVLRTIDTYLVILTDIMIATKASNNDKFPVPKDLISRLEENATEDITPAVGSYDAAEIQKVKGTIRNVQYYLIISRENVSDTLRRFEGVEGKSKEFLKYIKNFTDDKCQLLSGIIEAKELLAKNGKLTVDDIKLLHEVEKRLIIGRSKFFGSDFLGKTGLESVNQLVAGLNKLKSQQNVQPAWVKKGAENVATQAKAEEVQKRTVPNAPVTKGGSNR